MKNFSKKVISLMLIMMMVVSGFSFAGTTTNADMESLLRGNTPSTGEKISDNLSTLDVSDDENVRVIVELSEKPIISYATERGVKISELGESYVDKLSNSIESEQNAVIEDIESSDVEVDVLNRFENVFNGFSINVKYGEVEKIAELSNVKKVYIANRYERPEPQMSNSFMLTQSKYVNEKLGMTGKGIVVSIIDSGIDPSHKDFKLDKDTVVALTESTVSDLVDKYKLAGQFHTNKVPYGYNYMDKNQEVRDLGVDANMHGMHVGGTVGANGELKGVAPNVQILAMKVFGNDPEMPSTFGDIIVKAIDDSIALGADVMNLSLGSSAAFVDPEDPEQVAVKKAVEAGIIMSISAGNSAHYGYGYSNSKPFATNPDVGVVGSPGLSNDSLQVASVENFSLLNISSVKCAGTDMMIEGFGKDKWKDGKYTLVSIGGSKLGNPEDFEGMDLKDKVVLVSRGTLYFNDKTENAYKAGAKAIIVYNNNINNAFYKNLGGWSIPFMKIQVEEGKELEKLLAQNGGEMEIEVKSEVEYINPTTGELSDFSSWGVTPSLDFKPEISAPGGNIYSTLNDDHYGFMSGTSMAAPHVAGGSALVVERVNTDSVFKSFSEKNRDKAQLVKNILMNTAKPVVDNTYEDASGRVIGKSYTSVRRQGAGSMDLKAAMETKVVVTEKTSGIAKVSLGEIGDNITFDLEAKNYGSEDVVCTIDAMAQINEEKAGYNLLTTELLKDVAVNITVCGVPAKGAVTIKSNSTIDIKVTMDFSKVSADIKKKFPNGNFIEGFVFLKPYNEEALSNIDSLNIELQKAKLDAENKKKEVVLSEVKVTDQKAVIKALEDEKAKINSEIDQLEASNKEILSKNQSINDSYYSYNEAKNAYETLVSNNQGLDIAKEKDSLNALKGNLELLSSKVADLESKIAIVKEELEKLSGSTTSGSAAVVDNGEKEKLEAELSALQTDLTAKKSELAAAQAKVTNQETVVSDVQTILNSIETAKKAMENAKASYESTLATLTDAEKALVNEFTALKAEKEAKLANVNAKLVNENTILGELVKTFGMLTTELTKLNELVVTAQNNYNNAGESYNNILPLSVPFLGFYGNWGDAPAFDSPLYDKKNSFYGLTGLYNISGEDEDFLGGDIKGVITAEHVSISPNGDDYLDSALPIISVHRNVKDVEFNILDSNKKVLRTIGKAESYRKTFYDGGEGKRYYYLPSMKWDGTVNMETVPDGKYFYQIKGILSDDDKTVKELNLPIVVDTKDPEIETYLYKNGDKTLTVKASDNGVGIKAYILYTIKGGKVEVLERNTTGIFDISKITIAPNAVFFAVTDFAGNMASSDEPIVINDKLAPDVKLTNVEAFGVMNTKEFIAKGTAAEFANPTILVDGEKVDVTFNKETGLYEFEKSFKFDSDGKKGINVEASDYMGNKVEFIRHFYIDSTPVELTVTPSIALKEGEINHVKADQSTIKFDIKAVDKTFPDLELRFNKDVIYKVEKDYVSYESLMKDVEYTTSKEITLKDGLNKVLIEAVDAGGNLTKVEYQIYKLVKDETAPKLSKEEYTVDKNGVAFNRPLEVSMATEGESNWTMIVKKPNGDEAFKKELANSKEFNASWKPELENKLNGSYTCEIKAESGNLTLTSSKTFEVYNFEFKRNSVVRVDRMNMLNVVAEVENLDNVGHEPLILVQIRKENGAVISIGTAQATVEGGKTVKLSSGIPMPEAGKYTAEIRIWTAFDDGRVLSDDPRLGDGIIEFTVK